MNEAKENSPLPGADMDDSRFRIRPYQQMLSSCTGALLTSLFMTPLDVVKTRLQTQQKMMLSNKCYLYCNGLMDHICPCGPNGISTPFSKPTTHFSGTIDALVKITRYEGIRSLWSGLSPTLVLAVPTTVIYFVAYEQFRVKLKELYLGELKPSSELPVWIPLLAGGAARVLAVTIVNPLELIRTKMQSEKISYTEVGRGFRSMLKVHGVSGLWKGFFPTILRDVPFSALYWTAYETIKKRSNVTQPTFGFSFAAGGISGGIAAFLTVPFDVVKTHQQIEFGEQYLYAEKNGQKQTIKSTSTFDTMRNIYVRSGVKGLFAGCLPRLGKVSLACAIMIATFEYGKNFFYNYNVHTYLTDREKSSIAKMKSQSNMNF